MFIPDDKYIIVHDPAVIFHEALRKEGEKFMKNTEETEMMTDPKLMPELKEKELPQAMVDPNPDYEFQQWKDNSPGRWVCLADKFPYAYSVKGKVLRPFQEFQYWWSRYHTHILLYAEYTNEVDYIDNQNFKTPIIDTFVSFLGVYDNLNSLSDKIENFIANRSKFKRDSHSYRTDIEYMYKEAFVDYWNDRLSIDLRNGVKIYALPMDLNHAGTRQYGEAIRYRDLDTQKLNVTGGELMNKALEEATYDAPDLEPIENPDAISAFKALEDGEE